jgi:two-component system, LytTR family, response regulator LytT
MFQVLVAEDDGYAKNVLLHMLEVSGLVDAVKTVHGIAEARHALSAPTTINAAFVDVRLGHAAGDDGLSLVRSMVSVADAPAFVLATETEDHALEAFELGVFDYLVKPFREERITSCLKRLHQRSARVTALDGWRRLVARRRRNLVFLEPEEVWAFEAANPLTFAHTRHGVFDLDMSLAEVQTLGWPFVRVHPNWLVSPAHVKELQRDGEPKLFIGTGMSDVGPGIRVPVAHEWLSAVRKMLLTGTAGLRPRSRKPF